MTLGLERAKVAPPSVYLALDGEPRAFHLLIPYIEVTEMLRVEGFSILKELLEALLDFPRSTLNICSLDLDKLGLTERDQSVEPFESTSHILNDLHLTNVSLYPSSSAPELSRDLPSPATRFVPLGSLVSFSEENPSPETTRPGVGFAEPAHRHSNYQITSKIQILTISLHNPMDNKVTDASNDPPEKRTSGNWLHVRKQVGLDDILSDDSVAYLPSLSPPPIIPHCLVVRRQDRMY